MSEANERIERFKFMTQADPNNELGHYSLGRAYLESAQPVDAAASLRRAIEINPNLSKAYQLLAQAFLDQGEQGQAVATLTQGVTTADTRGDVLPRNEMIQMLEKLGAVVPQISSGASNVQVAVGDGEVMCRRCGRASRKLEKPPFRNDFGKQIFESTCALCWREAIGMGTKVINELRLDLSDPKAQKIWDANIREFLNLT